MSFKYLLCFPRVMPANESDGVLKSVEFTGE